jgi:hypothetical protein
LREVRRTGRAPPAPGRTPAPLGLTAASLFRILSDQGDVSAQYNLGIMNLSGQGIRQDYAEAMRWFRKAASLKSTLATPDRRASSVADSMWIVLKSHP